MYFEWLMSSLRSHHVLCRKRVFLIQTCSYEQTDTKEKMINRNMSQWFSFYFCSWKCVIDMLLRSLTNILPLHISYIKFICANRKNSRLDRVSKEYTEQIRKRYCYPFRFFHRHSLFIFRFFCFLSPYFLFSFFLKSKIYILINIWLCGRVSDKKKFYPDDFLRQEYVLFWPY